MLEESAGRTNPRFNAAGKVGKAAGPVLTAVAVGIAIKNVHDAPPGQKVPTAEKEAGGLGGAFVGGEIGAAAFAPTGPGSALGAVGGAIIGGFGGRAIVENLQNSPRTTPNIDNSGCSQGSGPSCR